MFRTVAVSSLLALALVPAGQTTAFAQATAPAAPPASAQNAAAPVAATPENAAAFIGDWTLSAEGANGPATFALTVKDDGGKVAGEISSEMQAKTPITDVWKGANNLILKYTFDYQGMAVPVVITLTPGAGDKVDAQFDFADGAYQMAGTAKKGPGSPQR
jgi:hypothetical protein